MEDKRLTTEEILLLENIRIKIDLELAKKEATQAKANELLLRARFEAQKLSVQAQTHLGAIAKLQEEWEDQKIFISEKYGVDLDSVSYDDETGQLRPLD